MRRIIFISLLLALAAHGQPQRIAIINTEDDGEPSIGILEQAHLTAKLREIANSILPKERYGIMTQQSIIDRLGSQERAVKECREATCLADLGRKVNADFIAQARIGRFGGALTIRTELYNVASGNLIASFTGDSENAKGLLSVLDTRAPDMFKSMLPKAGEPATAAPAIVGGVALVKHHTVNLTTEPKGANLSFNGMPNSSCLKTPCKASLPEGNVRIIAVFKQHENADTSVAIVSDNQNINIKLKSSLGLFRVKPAYASGIGKGKAWDLTINGKAYDSLNNRMPQGTYDVKLSHRCYDDLNLKVAINKGSEEVFDMEKHIKLKEGVLEMRAKRGGQLVSEPVFINGRQAGATPFSSSIPICSKMEIGNEKNPVGVKLKHNGKIRYTYKMEGDNAEEGEDDDAPSRDGVKFGVRAGFNANDFLSGYEGLNEGMSRGIGLGAGLLLKVPVVSQLSVNVGADFYYRDLFSKETEAGTERMSELVVSVPVFLQYAPPLFDHSRFNVIAGGQMDYPVSTTWDAYDYFTERRKTYDFGALLGLVYMAGPTIGVDFRCVIGLAGLFENFESPYVDYYGSNSYEDKSSLMQYSVGVIYFF